MSVLSILTHIGKDILAIFKGATTVALDIEPFFDAAAPSLATLYNATVAAIIQAEALGASVPGNTSAQKLANAVAAVTPTAETVLGSIGVNVNKTVVTNYVNGIVAAINAIPAPAAKTAAIAPAAGVLTGSAATPAATV